MFASAALLNPTNMDMRNINTMLTITKPLFFCLYVITQCAVYAQQTKITVSVSATAPISAVDEGGILSLHCEVKDLGPGQSIMLVRQSGDTLKSLSWKDVVQTTDDDRVFLAVRQLPGNTFVYFLSIIDVTRQDEAEYSCRVMSSSLEQVVARDSVRINVNYFPPETSPVCTHNVAGNTLTSQISVNEGDMVNLNCTSERGFPVVSIQWTKSGRKFETETVSPSRGSPHVFGILRFRASRLDDSTVFLCQVQSMAFPGKLSTCHVGVSVRYDNTIKVDTTDSGSAPGLIDTDASQVATITTMKNDVFIGTDSHDIRCKEYCSLTSGPGYYWVIATVVAGCLAVTFLVIGTVLLIKYCRLATTYGGSSETGLQCAEDFYEKLQYRDDRGDMVYMSLGNANRLHLKDNSEVHYCLAPNKPTTRPLTE